MIKKHEVLPINYWTRDEALKLCTEIEKVCQPFGCHVALTGGLLYKSDRRPDCDIMFYRIRQVERINIEALFAYLEAMGFEKFARHGFCNKSMYKGKLIDVMFPEHDGEYDVRPGETMPGTQANPIVMDELTPLPATPPIG